MKLIIAKCLIAGSILLGLGVIACENRGDMSDDNNNRNEEYTPAASGDGKTDVDENNGMGVRDSATLIHTDTSYDSTSDTVYRRR